MVPNFKMTVGNTEFRELCIKRRKCTFFTIPNDSGILTQNGLSLIKLAQLSSRLSTTIKKKTCLTAIEVHFRQNYKYNSPFSLTAATYLVSR